MNSAQLGMACYFHCDMWNLGSGVAVSHMGYVILMSCKR
jgi:hypothetical protein